MADIVVLFACTLCGFVIGKYFERQLRGKATFWNDLCKYLALFAVNIDGRQLEIGAFNNEFAQNCSGVFAEYLSSGKIRCRLSAQEKTELRALFECLGAASSLELKREIDYRSAFIEGLSKRYSEQAARASIYPKLGLLVGMMVGIVLI